MDESVEGEVETGIVATVRRTDKGGWERMKWKGEKAEGNKDKKKVHQHGGGLFSVPR